MEYTDRYQFIDKTGTPATLRISQLKYIIVEISYDSTDVSMFAESAELKGSEIIVKRIGGQLDRIEIPANAVVKFKLAAEVKVDSVCGSRASWRRQKPLPEELETE